MKDGIPTLFWLFRWCWSGVHLIILGVLLAVFLMWALTDNQGADALDAWLRWIESLRDALTDLMPYPWG